MTALRERMIEDMQVRNLSPRTQRAYLQYISQFACHFRKSPDLLGPAEIRAFQLYLTRDRQLAASSIGVAVAAIRFLYKVTLQRGWNVDDVIPTCRRPQTLPVVMSPDRGRQISRRCREPQAPRDPDRLLRSRSADFGGGPLDARRDRQPTHDHPRGAGQRAERPLRDALAQAARHPPRLLPLRSSEGVAVPRRSARSTDHGLRGGGPAGPCGTSQHRQAGHAALPASCICRSSARVRHRSADHPVTAWPLQSRHHGKIFASRRQRGVRHRRPLDGLQAAADTAGDSIPAPA